MLTDEGTLIMWHKKGYIFSYKYKETWNGDDFSLYNLQTNEYKHTSLIDWCCVENDNIELKQLATKILFDKQLKEVLK
jgi:hypothetical protein